MNILPVKQVLTEEYIEQRQEGLSCEVAFQKALSMTRDRVLFSLYKTAVINNENDFIKIQRQLVEYQTLMKDLSDGFALTQSLELNYSLSKQGVDLYEIV